MADNRRFFSSTYYGDQLGNKPRHHQRQRQTASDPLKDLQHLLSRLVAERDSREGKAAFGGCAVRTQAAGDTWLYEDPFRQPLQQHQHHKRFFSDQDRKTRSYPSEVQSARAAGIAGADADFGFNTGRLANDFEPRQWGRSGFSENSSSDRLAGPRTGPNRRQIAASGVVSGDKGGGRRAVLESWRCLDDSVTDGESEIPIVDERTERGLEGVGNHCRAGRVPSSPSWPLTCVIQHSDFTHYTRPTSIYQEVETTDLRPIGQGIRDLTDGLTTQPVVAAAAKVKQEAVWHQTLPITAAETAALPARRKLSTPVSAKREATLRASAEKLDNRSGRGPSPSRQQHRRAFSSGDEQRGLIDISGDRAPDYEAVSIVGDDPWRLEDGEAQMSAAQASMSMWYRPSISREQAVTALLQGHPGSFLIRDSHTYMGAFGLAVRVSRPSSLPASESLQHQQLVRHFLIESCKGGGVRLSGCANEPVFSNLVELVQCHQQVALALPCRLRLPNPPSQLQPPAQPPTTIQPRRLNSSVDENSRRGNIYRVLYFCTVDVASCNLTPNSSWASDAVSSAVNQVVAASGESPRPVECRMRVSDKGLKLSGQGWHKDFRLAYAAQDCSLCRLDPNGRRFFDAKTRIESRLFGLIVRKYGLYGNQSACLVLGDLEANQPAAVVAAFVNRCIRGVGGR